MPDPVDPLKAADDALAALKSAVTPLAKGAPEGDLGEATTAHVDGSKADAAAADFLKKADEARERAVKLTAEKKDDLAKAAHAEADDFIAKANEAVELAGANHELVKAFFEERGEALEKSEGDADAWKALGVTVVAYHDGLHKAALAKAERLEGLAKAARETDKDEASAKVLDEMAKEARLQVTAAEALVKAATPVEPTVLEKALAMEDGTLEIKTRDDLLKAMKTYGSLPVGNKPKAMAHIFNAAKALGAKLPEGWHAPDNDAAISPGHRKAIGATQQTAKVTDITEAQKAATLKKAADAFAGVVGLSVNLEALAKSDLVAVLGGNEATKATAESIGTWLTKGAEVLHGLVIIMGDSFPEAADALEKAEVAKSEQWASAAARIVGASITDDMPEETKTRRKDFAKRLDLAHEFFKKAADLPPPDVDKAVTEALAKVAGEHATALEAITVERDAARGKLTEVTNSLTPLVRSAQEQREALAKAETALAEKDAELKKLADEKVPPKGHMGPGGTVMQKNQDGAAGNPASSVLEKALELPPGRERAAALLDAAHKLRGAEKSRRDGRRA